MSSITRSIWQSLWRRTGIGIVIVLLTGLSVMGWSNVQAGHHPHPSGPVYTATDSVLGPQVSTGGLYRVSAWPAEPIKVRRIHAWEVRVETADGQPVSDAEVTVDGGMPAHGHGLPTKPRVTGRSGAGTYSVEGMKFNMRGHWTLRFEVRTPAGTDAVTFDLTL